MNSYFRWLDGGDHRVFREIIEGKVNTEIEVSWARFLDHWKLRWVVWDNRIRDQNRGQGSELKIDGRENRQYWGHYELILRQSIGNLWLKFRGDQSISVPCWDGMILNSGGVSFDELGLTAKVKVFPLLITMFTGGCNGWGWSDFEFF